MRHRTTAVNRHRTPIRNEKLPPVYLIRRTQAKRRLPQQTDRSRTVLQPVVDDHPVVARVHNKQLTAEHRSRTRASQGSVSKRGSVRLRLIQVRLHGIKVRLADDRLGIRRDHRLHYLSLRIGHNPLGRPLLEGVVPENAMETRIDHQRTVVNHQHALGAAHRIATSHCLRGPRRFLDAHETSCRLP